MSVPRVVIVGAGFGGLACARRLGGGPLDVLLVDRNNYHLFTPLLYQVASSLLNPGDIATPVRAILRGARNVRFRQAEVTGVDLEARQVRTAAGDVLPYDYLVLAAGSTTHTFGIASVALEARGLKDLPEALALRNHILRCFEEAARRPDAASRREWLTFVVVGGGPTGVEYAGALAELARLVLARDYPEFDSAEVEIVLLEGRERLLLAFPEALAQEARAQLTRRGVRVRTHLQVTGLQAGEVLLSTGERLQARTLVWAAGVRPAALAEQVAVPRSRSGRIEVDEFLRVRGQERVFAVGDVAAARSGDADLPMLAPVASQAGRAAADNILLLAGGRAPAPFRYRDRGTMATIGRKAAVAWIGRVQLKGFVGWVAWLVLHLYMLIGFRNRLLVMIGWAWNYFRYDRPIRIVAGAKEGSEPAEVSVRQDLPPHP
jgi:NADH dehydrogenase